MLVKHLKLKNIENIVLKKYVSPEYLISVSRVISFYLNISFLCLWVPMITLFMGVVGM